MAQIYHNQPQPTNQEAPQEVGVAGGLKVLETPDGKRYPEGPRPEKHQILHGASTSQLSSVVTKSPANTDALFPPLPVYGPPSLFRKLQILAYKTSSHVLSFSFLMVVVAGSLASTVVSVFRKREIRPFQAREDEAEAQRKKMGRAKLKCDLRYYAKRVGLDIEEFKVTTEDGFVLVMQRVFDPKDFKTEKKYPVLLMHGLLQSSGAFCSNDDNSLAFYLCKSGYDVYLGNNRCYYKPEHVALKSSDPRMWCWNIKQMGIFDLSTFVTTVIKRTGFAKIGLVAHSQGTTEAFVALAKEQHPQLGSQLSIFCALAPAVYSGPLIGKAYFKFMRLIPPWAFRIIFGIHSFIPFMLTMHTLVPGPMYGWLGYKVFSWLFGWHDTRWDKGLRSRGLMFAPVYVSAESMRWWLGRDGFATQKCILATRQEVMEEEVLDKEGKGEPEPATNEEKEGKREQIKRYSLDIAPDIRHNHQTTSPRHHRAWFDETFPPLALWIAGSDKLVDGLKLLHRFKSGREPHVKLVHSNLIPEYEHLDVIWAIDSIDQVGSEVGVCIWKSVAEDIRAEHNLRTPRGCENEGFYDELTNH